MTAGHTARGLAAPYALPTGFAALLGVGTVAAALGGRLPGTGVLTACAVVVALMSFVAEPLSAPALALIGWLTTAGFSRPPYGNLRVTGPFAAHAAIAVAASAAGAAALGVLYRWSARRFTLVGMAAPSGAGRDGWPAAATGRDGAPAQPGPFPERYLESGQQPGLAGAIDTRRRLIGAALALALIPLLTVALVAARRYLDLDDDLLIYLVIVVATAVVGGFWPAVLAAVAASLLVNWYFTAPLHTFTIEEPRNLLALVLFVTVAVAVSSVVHLAARRAQQAAHSRAEAASLLVLAQTVLGGADTPSAVLEHLTTTLGGRAELRERVAGRWVPVAASGVLDDVDGTLLAWPERHPTELARPERHPTARIDIRPDLTLLVAEQARAASPGLLVGFAAQAAAALDRERLRTQAAQAEALAEGNRMRTALLAAVSHDLRTPLASIKASASTLRQTDVEWTAADQAALLATIDANADRLDALIGNLLDMSRLHTGSLDPFLRPTAIDEVAPVALRGLDAAVGYLSGGDSPAWSPSGKESRAQLRIEVPDGLPLVRADPGLLERVLANLFSNALRHSPPSRPPLLRARQLDQRVLLEVVDHGPGVPDELKQRIFEPFLRLDRQHGGVGLGLAVAKGFAEAMGGTIGAADTPGGGLTIKVTLPTTSSDARTVLGAGP
jgi:two-component system, OmpR family, sensor histidine kinase KdpD